MASLSSTPPDIITGSLGLVDVLKKLGVALASKKDLDVVKKLTAYNANLGNYLTLNARMTKNLALNAVEVGKKVYTAVNGFYKGEFKITGSNLGEVLKVLTVN